MRVSMIRFLLVIAVLMVFLAPGCRGDTPASLEPEGSLEKINIFNTPSALQPGAVHAVGATGIYSGFGTYRITAYATWATSDPAVIEIIGKGLLHAVGGGTATITCSYKGVTSQPVEIEVSGPALPGTAGPAPVILSNIQVEPTSAMVAINGTIQFSATAVYSNGFTQDITGLVDWRVSDDEPGFIIDADNANAWGSFYGLFKATGPVGTTVVSAAYLDSVSNYVTVVVKQF